MSTKGIEAGRETGLLRKNAASSRVKRRPQKNLDLAIFSGLLLLLVTLTVVVVERATEFPTDPAFINYWVSRQLSAFYFAKAKLLIRPLCQGPIEKWSSALADNGTGCVSIGNGVWYAAGTVDTRSKDGLPIRLPWAIYFIADTSTPLFRKVGNDEIGDHALAIRLSKSKTASAPAGP